MTAILWLMVWFAMEKRKRANFERFWYSHHVRSFPFSLRLREVETDTDAVFGGMKLFVIFFFCWQMHGMFCKAHIV
jgi:hypothetical protein